MGAGESKGRLTRRRKHSGLGSEVYDDLGNPTSTLGSTSGKWEIMPSSEEARIKYYKDGSLGKNSDTEIRRNSRYGLFTEDDSDDDTSVEVRSQMKLSQHQPLHVPDSINDEIQQSPREESSPSSSSKNLMYHIHYNSETDYPFSPLYNLPNISPYPTPMTRGQSRELISLSGCQSEDVNDTPFRALRSFQSPRIDANLHERDTSGNTRRNHHPKRQKYSSTRHTADLENRIAMELESLHRVGPSYNDPLNVLMNRFKNINAKEKHHSEEIANAIDKLSVSNSVEAEKRNLLFRQFEEQDKETKAEALRAAKREKEIKEEAAQRQRDELQQKERDILVKAQEEVERAEKEKVSLLAVKALNEAVTKEAKAVALLTTPGSSKIYSVPPHVRDAQFLVQWVEKSQSRVCSVELPAELAAYLTELESQLLSFGSSSSSSTAVDSDAMEGDRSGGSGSGSGGVGVSGNIRGMLSVASMAQKLLRAGAALGGDAFLSVLCRLLKAAMGCVCQGAKPATTTLIGNVIVGMFLVLPTESSSSDSENPDKTGQSLQQQGALVFKAMLYGESELCIPHVSRGEQSGVIDIDRQRRRVAAVELLGALIGTQSKNSPVSIEEGWTWLVRLGKSLTHAVERRKEGDTSVSSLQCQECCTALYLYLRQGSAALIAHYGWQTVLSVFKAIRTVIVSTSEGASSIKGAGGVVLCESESGKQLVAWVDAAIATDGVKCAEKLKHHEPHVMASYMVISSMSEARLESDEIDRDKKGQIMTRIKQLRIHSIPGIFNRLSATSASQILVVKELLDKISAAGSENIPAILRYTLCKIASQLVAQAQSEFFIIEDESQSIPIARVAVGLCRNKPELVDILRSEYFRVCPLTVPRQVEGGLTGDEMFESMGFLRIQDRWEESDVWQTRMNKVLCAFAVTVIQPEGIPFSLSDGWGWLANMINACSRIPIPSSYTADALDIFLRIVSPVMSAAYGKRFLELLMITERHILPKLKENSSKIRLTEFLQVFRESRGTNFLPFFNKK